jgi:hypothetical protein
MANRTIKFMGKAVSDSDNVTITFAFNGNEVFNAVVPAISSVDTADTDGTIALFTFDVDQTLNGVMPTSLTVSGGDVFVVSLVANYSLRAKSAGVDGNGVSYEEVTSDNVVNDFLDIGTTGEPKLNIQIDGSAFEKGDIGTLLGAWSVPVRNGETMSCDYNLSATPI